MYRTWLIPYLEGVLDERRHAELEERLLDDPSLAAELEALRRALPHLQARFTLPAEFDALPLWPHLRERLARTPRRQVRAAFFRCAAGALMIALLIPLAFENQRTTSHENERADIKWRRELRGTPRVVFYRDNSLGTRTARRLETHARRVSAERRAAILPIQTVASSEYPRSAETLTF